VAIIAAGVATFIFFSVSAPHFLTVSNLLDIARGYAFVAIVGVGMTYLLIAGELDLSVGSLNGFSGVVMAWLIINAHASVWLAFGAAILLGAAVGLINGAVTALVGVPSFIVTLGMLSLLQGAGLVLTDGLPIDLTGKIGPGFYSLATGKVGSVPAPVLWLLGVVVLGGAVLKFTPFGYSVYATGGNRRAAQQVGIRTTMVRMSCFVLTGVLAALAGGLTVGLLSEGAPSTGAGFELTVIAAVIIGGTALYGGEGSVLGTVVGAAILGMIDDGLVLLGLNSNLTIVFTGGIVIVVGAVNVLTTRGQGSQRLGRFLGRTRREGGI
jgi:ribose transport system permease protein